MYRDNREIQELSDQDAVCRELSKRLVEDLPEDLIDQAVYDANARLEDMIARQGMSIDEFCKQRGISEAQLYEDTKERTIQSLKEDSALEAYAAHAGLTLDAEDFYASSPATTSKTRRISVSKLSLTAVSSRWKNMRLRRKLSRRSWKMP